MKTTKKERMYAEIQQHGENLNAIFNTGIDPVKLCKKLHTLEAKATRLTTDQCNTGNSHHAELCKILTSVKKILFSTLDDKDLFLAVHINGDPRGYALKIKDEIVRERQMKIYTDMGGYGILSPEFTGKTGY